MAANKQNMHANDAHAGKKFKGDTFTADPSMLLTEVPPCPEHFSDGQKFWFTYLCSLFIEAKTLSRLYIMSITNYAKLCARIEEFEIEIEESGGTFCEVHKTFKGEDYVAKEPNPLLDKLHKLYDQHDRLANSLGMTPYGAKVLTIDATGSKSAEVTATPPAVDLPPPETATNNSSVQT